MNPVAQLNGALARARRAWWEAPVRIEWPVSLDADCECSVQVEDEEHATVSLDFECRLHGVLALQLDPEMGR